MATVPLTSWYDDVVPHAPGCPLPLALKAIRDAAIDFCKRSRTWRFLGATPIDAVAGQQTYAVSTVAAEGTLPADTVLAHVYQVNYDGGEIDFLTPEQFRAQCETWFSDQGCVTAWTMFDEASVSLLKIPSADLADAIVIPEVALAPSQASTTIDAGIFERYRRAIAKGALSLLYLSPDKPYTNGALGEALQLEFNAACGSADARASSGRGRGRLRTQTIYR